MSMSLLHPGAYLKVHRTKYVIDLTAIAYKVSVSEVICEREREIEIRPTTRRANRRRPKSVCMERGMPSTHPPSHGGAQLAISGSNPPFHPNDDPTQQAKSKVSVHGEGQTYSSSIQGCTVVAKPFVFLSIEFLKSIIY